MVKDRKNPYNFQLALGPRMWNGLGTYRKVSQNFNIFNITE